MKTLPPKNNSFSSEAHIPEYILTKWLSTITDFHKYYQLLTICIDQTTVEPKKLVYIGQCPINLLVELISTMREELKNLELDIDQLDKFGPSSVFKNYKKLATHTRVLNQLNQQAQNRLYMATLFGS